MIYLLIIFCVWEKQIQTDWMGGAGVPGPVTNWSTRYYESDSVTVATEGQASLIATSRDYTSSGWVKHIIESNLGIGSGVQGFMPADIGNDGTQDLVAHSNDSVFWYKNVGNYVFTKQPIGSASAVGSNNPCVFPYDLDKDNDIDVLVSTAGSGLGWFENDINNTPPWIYHQIATGSYHRVSATDIDLDGDIDVIAVNNSDYGYGGTVQIFKNNGSQNFGSPVQSIDESGYEGWRVYPVDFNKDGYQDIYSVYWNTYVYLNDGTSNPGHFTKSFFADYWSGNSDFDGGWPSDINMDGNMDLVCGGYGSDHNFHALLGDGTGSNFTRQALTFGSFSDYMDGALAVDLDLDSLPDILGTFYKVGWFRQTGALTFTPYNIDNLTDYSHWMYAAPLGNKCTPSIDILVTQGGEHIVYENKMIKSFAKSGGFTSSILELSDTLKQLKYFGWKACVPGNSTLAFWCRADTSGARINSQVWVGPYYATKNIDSIALAAAPCVNYFQYKVEFAPQDTPIDIAVLYEISLSYDTCGGGYVEETKAATKLSLEIIGNKIMLSPGNRLNNAELCIYNTAGEFVQTLYKGELEAKTYIFTPELKRKGVYLVVCKYDGNTKTVKFVKMR
ncbi:MAG: T9SS type A sorting domain-containing protein [bacterium]|nr:T9SS type A sorting domain-containing protein [bacterium]